MGIHSYEDLKKALIDLYNRQAYRQGLELIAEHGRRFPGQADRIFFFQVCLASRLGDTAGSLGYFQSALDAGFWYTEKSLRGDPDLAALQGLPEFERLVAVSKSRQAKAQAGAAPQLKAFPPHTAGGRLPLFVALHGNTVNMQQAIDRWSSVVERGWLLATPQSSQVSGPDSYVWDDYDLAAQEMRAHLASLESQYPLDPRRRVIGGFSMGGGLAAWLALKGEVEVEGFVLLGAFLMDVRAIRPLVAARRERPIPGYILIGDRDESCLPVARELRSAMAGFGLPVEMEVLPGLDHDFPPDFACALERALEFIESAGVAQTNS